LTGAEHQGQGLGPASDRWLREHLRVAGLGRLKWGGADGLWQADGTARAILGLPADDAADRACDLVPLPADDVPEALSLIRETGQEAMTVEIPLFVAGRERLVVAFAGRPDGVGGDLSVTVQDVTALRAGEAERVAMMAGRIAEANRLEALGTLAGGIAHEINNPAQYVGDNLVFLSRASTSLLGLACEAERAAAGLSSWSDVADRVARLRLDFLRKELPTAADQAIDGIARIGDIVQAIRDFCYPGAKALTLFNLNHLVEIAVAVTRNQWKFVAALDVDLDAALPMINAVEGEIAQVLVNLIINAAHAIAEAQSDTLGRIVVTTRQIDAFVELTVADSGVGIPAAALGRIFEMFYTTKPPGQGTGQGLAISHAIVSRHEGRIVVDSRPGEGARFSICLPIAGPQS
jgi:signal transduction histidine kinase